MARHDVYANPNGSGYLIDVQADLLGNLSTRLVVPMMSVSDSPPVLNRLNPIFDIQSERYVMVTQFLAAVPASILKTPVTSLVQSDAEIMAALDMALTGV
jgi:toxin CcdB